MNGNNVCGRRNGLAGWSGGLCAMLIGFALSFGPLASLTAEAATTKAAAPKKTTKAPAKPEVKAAAPEAPLAVEGEPRATVTELDVLIGRSNLVNLTANVSRVSLGNPAVADVTLTSPRQLYILGKSLGSTNVMLWDKAGRMVAAIDVNVSREFGALNSEIQKLVAKKGNVRVRPVGDAVVLEGNVSDSRLAARVSELAETLAGKKVVNMLAVDGVHQVMLEVKIAEVNRTLADKLGIKMDINGAVGDFTWSLLSNYLFPDANGVLPATGMINVGRKGTTTPAFGLDAEKGDGLVKILAEPNIVAMSGQEGSFLAGGEIYIPVPQSLGTTTLESKQFGVGLRFTPTVLEDGRISMRVLPEVTDLVGFTTISAGLNGATLAVPTLTTRRAATTVELRDGQSLAIGGLMKDNVREAIKRLPILGEIPILGALFRSSEFQTDKTELLIVITPRLIKPLPANYSLPTDAFKEPSRPEFFLEGRMEGKGATDAAQPAAQPAPAATGHQLK